MKTSDGSDPSLSNGLLSCCALLVLASLFAGNAWATSVMQKPLDELVMEADYVLVAAVTSVDMIDGRGRPVHDPEARTGPGLDNQMRLHLEVDEVIFDRAGSAPPTLIIPLWKMWHYQLGTIREQVMGHRAIFLLKEDSQQVYPAFFQRSLDEREEIEALLRQNGRPKEGQEGTEGIDLL